jgi:HSP20 family protein
MVDSFFGDDFFNAWREPLNLPAVNVKETEKAFNLEVAAPGLEKDDFKIEVDKGFLTISAEKEESNEEKDDQFTRREFSFRSFKRSFWLPEGVNADKILAKYENGVLNVELPKVKATVKPVKTIKVA